MLLRLGRAFVLMLVGLLGGCESQGQEDQPCKADSQLGPSYCDDPLLCNTAIDPPKCQKPMSRKQGDPCSSTDLCTMGLWCNGLESKCQPLVGENEPCVNPFSCRPGLSCQRTADGAQATCRP